MTEDITSAASEAVLDFYDRNADWRYHEMVAWDGPWDAFVRVAKRDATYSYAIIFEVAGLSFSGHGFPHVAAAVTAAIEAMLAQWPPGFEKLHSKLSERLRQPGQMSLL